MIRLSYTISKVIVDEYGQQELLRRLSDALWFQAFGCVLGFDWHSSGVTTVVTGVMKESLNEDIHGISIAGGKGKKSIETKTIFPSLLKNITIYPLPKLIIYCMQARWQQKEIMPQSKMAIRYIIM
jgi:hypothetical protein